MINIGKLETTPVDSSNAVDKEVVKKDKYDVLVKKTNAIQISDTANDTTDCDKKLVKLKRKLLIMIIIIQILLHKNLINVRKFCCRIKTSNDFVEKTDFDDQLKI